MFWSCASLGILVCRTKNQSIWLHEDSIVFPGTKLSICRASSCAGRDILSCPETTPLGRETPRGTKHAVRSDALRVSISLSRHLHGGHFSAGSTWKPVTAIERAAGDNSRYIVSSRAALHCLLRSMARSCWKTSRFGTNHRGNSYCPIVLSHRIMTFSTISSFGSSCSRRDSFV